MLVTRPFRRFPSVAIDLYGLLTHIWIWFLKQQKMCIKSKWTLPVLFFLLALWFFMLMFTDRAIFVGSVAPWQAPVEVEEEE